MCVGSYLGKNCLFVQWWSVGEFSEWFRYFLVSWLVERSAFCVWPQYERCMIGCYIRTWVCTYACTCVLHVCLRAHVCLCVYMHLSFVWSHGWKFAMPVCLCVFMMCISRVCVYAQKICEFESQRDTNRQEWINYIIHEWVIERIHEWVIERISYFQLFIQRLRLIIWMNDTSAYMCP